LKRHPYIIATIAATLLAIVVWLIVPKEYTAVTKLSDEYKEMDLAIGLSQMQQSIKNALGSTSQGINDMETYCKILKAEDFARTLSHKKVPELNVTYGQYLGKKDTIETIINHINYNYSNTKKTVAISFTDRNAVVAAQMLDSITTLLQERITYARQVVINANLRNFQKAKEDAKTEYLKALREYTMFSDSHQSSKTKVLLEEENAFLRNLYLAYNNYREAVKQHVRYTSLMKRSYMSFAVIQNSTVPHHYNSYFISFLIPFILIALSLVKGIKLFKARHKERITIEYGGFFSPWSLSILVWFGMLTFFSFYSDQLYPITDQFYISITIWLTIFVLTSFATFNLMEHKSVPYSLEGIEINKSFYYLFFFVTIILSPMYMYKVWQIVSMFDTKDMMTNIRTLSVYGDSMGILYYATVLAPALLTICLWRYPKIPLWQLVVIIICCIINSLSIMEKGTFFLLVLCSIYVLYERGKIKVRTIGGVFIAILFLFYFFNLMRGGEETDYAKNTTLLDFVAMYIMSPPVAFGTVTADISDIYGHNSLSMIYAIIERLGIAHVETGEKLQEFVYVPIATNVYTILQPFFRDFGYIGIAFFSGVYGVFHGFLYRLSKNGNAFGICLYTYEVYILVLQFYQENIFISGLYYILLLLVIYLCTQRHVKVNSYSNSHRQS